MSSSLPGSAMTVLLSLKTSGPMCPRDISHRTKLPLRTVSFALKQLLMHHLIKKIPNLQDMRRPLYSPDSEGAKRLMAKHGMDSVVAMQVHMLMRR